MNAQLSNSFKKAAYRPASEPDYEALWKKGRRMKKVQLGWSIVIVGGFTALLVVSIQAGLFSRITANEHVGVASQGSQTAQGEEGGMKLFAAGIEGGTESKPAVSVVNLATGESESAELAGFAPGDSPYPLAIAGDSLVYLGSDGVYSVPTDLTDPAEKLGSAAYFVPGAVYGRVWLAVFDESLPGTAVLKTVREVSADSGAVTADVPLPSGSWSTLIGEVSSGLVFEDDGAIVVWDPSNGEEVLELAGAFPLALSHQLVAWCPMGDCGKELHVTSVASHTEMTVRLPDNYHLNGESGGAFSPDGRYLAAAVIDDNDARRIAIIDLTSEEVRVIPGLVQGGPLAWSPSSDRLFVADEGRRLLSYGLETREIETVVSGLPPFVFEIATGRS